MSDLPVEKKSVEALVEDEEVADLLDYRYMEGMTGRDIIYEEGSMKKWISSEYSVDVKNWL
jgi:hypothetical protein